MKDTPKTFDEIEQEIYSRLNLKLPDLKIYKLLKFRNSMIVLLKDKNSFKGMKLMKLSFKKNNKVTMTKRFKKKKKILFLVKFEYDLIELAGTEFILTTNKQAIRKFVKEYKTDLDSTNDNFTVWIITKEMLESGLEFS